MKVALVGTGYIAGRHAVALSTMKAIEIVAHVDVVPGAAEKAAATYGGRSYTDVSDLLKHEKVDAAWICVPPFAHGKIEEAFIEQGIPLYIEKPVAQDLSTPQALAQLIADKKLVVSVGYYWRCMEPVARLQQLLVETPPRLIRGAYHGLTPPAPWWRVQAKSGGQIVEQATHIVDAARFLAGEAKVLKAVAKRHDLAAYPDADVSNVSAALLEFENGAVGSFTATSVLHRTLDVGIEFYCEGRKLTLSNTMLIVEDAQGRQETAIGRDPLAIADERFIEAIRQNSPEAVACSYEDALRTQELCCQIRDAANTGSPKA